MEGKAKNLDSLAEAAVMTANIGRVAARLIRVISFNSFLFHGSLAGLRGVSGHDVVREGSG